MTKNSWTPKMYGPSRTLSYYIRNALAFPSTVPRMTYEQLWIHLMDKICVFSSVVFPPVWIRYYS